MDTHTGHALIHLSGERGGGVLFIFWHKIIVDMRNVFNQLDFKVTLS